MKTKNNGDAKSEPSSLEKLNTSEAPAKVGDVMTKKIVTMSPHDTFREAVGLMANRPFRHFLVVENDSRLAGVISDRDLLRILSRNPDWHNTTVSEVMTREVVTVAPETLLSVAVEIMVTRRINCLPVVDGSGKVCGLVTSTDFLNAYRQVQASLERLREVGLA